MQTLRSSVKDIQRDMRNMESNIVDILNKFEDDYGVELTLGVLTRKLGSTEIGRLNIRGLVPTK